MSEARPVKFFNPQRQGIILILTGLVFSFFFWILEPFVAPDASGLVAAFFQAYMAAVLSGVFWMASNMFTLVLLDQKANPEWP
jgi:uncharacterized membrane-anchored protein